MAASVDEALVFVRLRRFMFVFSERHGEAYGNDNDAEDSCTGGRA